MIGTAGCPTSTTWDQFLRGQFGEREGQQLIEHLSGCAHCLQTLADAKTDDPLVKILHAQVASASGPEKAAAIDWLLERVKVSVSMMKTPKAPPQQVTVAGGKALPTGDTSPAMAVGGKAPLTGDAQEATAAGGKALPAGDARSELCKFLSPAQDPGELGWLGNYRILEVLGAGGMGVVFRGEDTQLKRHVAIKAILPAMANYDEIRQRFLREAQAVAAIDDDHVIPIYQIAEEKGVPYLAMPLLKGETLDQWLKKKPQPTVGEILRLAREMATGLAAAHAKGLIHRDIKPGNIWLEAPNGRVKILDFGLARPVNDQVHLTQSGFVAGTPAYMSPEQARGLRIDERTDLFSLGAVLYLLCTGELPFKGDTNMAILTALAVDNPRPVTELAPELPDDFARLIMQLLVKDPAKRPESALSVVLCIQDLERVLARKEPGALTAVSRVHVAVNRPSEAETPVYPEKQARRRPHWSLLVAGAAALALLVLGVIAWKPSPRSEKREKAAPGIADPPGAVVAADPGKSVAMAQPGKPFSNSIGMKFAYIPAGEFMMGSPPDELSRQPEYESVQHKVRISKPFYLGVFEVKQSEYQVVMGRNPSKFKDRPDHPVETVNWQNADEFCKKLSDRPEERKASRRYRLPTEAEWEYACRAGSTTVFSHGNTLSSEQANFNGEAPYGGAPKGPRRNETMACGTFPANAFGLHDMHGNVWEWCGDSRRDYPNVPPKDALVDPHGELDAADHLMHRGGSFPLGGHYCRSARRFSGVPTKTSNDLGFRVLLEAPTDLATQLASSDWEWSPPENLGLAINTRERELAPTLTDDECTLVFLRDDKLWMSRRRNIAEPFGNPVPLPDTINNKPGDASLSGDGLILVFSSYRPGSQGDDIWMTTRKTVDDPFGAPIQLAAPVNSGHAERHPVLSSDGLTLLLTNTRQGAGDIMMFTRKTRSDPFDNATLLPSPINTPRHFDVACWISADGRVLVTMTHVERPYQAHFQIRPSPDQPFGPARSFGPRFEKIDFGHCWLSPDGQRMYFHTRDLPGGQGDLDLWMCRRQAKEAAPVAPVAVPLPSPKPGVGKPTTPTAKTAAKDGKVKVFILAGQSDMAGRAKVRTLDWLGQDPKHAHLLPKIKDPDGTWVVRDDVWIDHRHILPERTVRAGCGSLTVGYGQDVDEIGPELLFGHVMGDYYKKNQVLLIKITQGPMSLALEARPPSSGGETGLFYKTMLADVRAVLANLKINFPTYHDQGHEIAGIVWFQGWNDLTSREVNNATRFQDYEKNLANFIRDVRKDLALPKLPLVIGELGVEGATPSGGILRMREAQAAVAARPEFQGNVILVKTSECWDPVAYALISKSYDMVRNKWTDDKAKQEFDKMGSNLPFLYMGSGKINALIGQAFGEAMKKLCSPP